jgi:Xaa-Pro aminopeptidase
MVDFSPFVSRRHRLLAELEDGVLVCFAATPTVRNNDVTHEFRQDSDFYYLTGFDEPDAALVLVAGEVPRSILFSRPRDPDRERWDGERMGLEGAAQLGVDEARAISELDEVLPRLLIGRRRLWVVVGCHAQTRGRTTQFHTLQTVKMCSPSPSESRWSWRGRSRRG